MCGAKHWHGQSKKRMTRRTRGLEEINKAPDEWIYLGFKNGYAQFDHPSKLYPTHGYMGIKCPFGQVGDGIWQRETFRIGEYSHKKFAQIIYRAGGEKTYFGWNDWLESNTRFAASTVGDGERWRSPLFMPRFASRFDPPITELRAERLQEISEADAIREGIQMWQEMYRQYDAPLKDAGWTREPIFSFQTLWDKYNAKRGHGWSLNEWVWPIGCENE